MAKEKQSMNNFGIGWGTILYCLLMFFLYVGMINDGTNVLAPAAAANCGVEPYNYYNEWLCRYDCGNRVHYCGPD